MVQTRVSGDVGAGNNSSNGLVGEKESGDGDEGSAEEHLDCRLFFLGKVLERSLILIGNVFSDED